MFHFLHLCQSGTSCRCSMQLANRSCSCTLVFMRAKRLNYTVCVQLYNRNNELKEVKLQSWWWFSKTQCLMKVKVRTAALCLLLPICTVPLLRNTIRQRHDDACTHTDAHQRSVTRRKARTKPGAWGGTVFCRDGSTKLPMKLWTETKEAKAVWLIREEKSLVWNNHTGESLP